MDFNQAQNAIQTPASPNGSYPELQALYRSQFQLPVAGGQMAGRLGQESFDLEEQKRTLKQKMQELEDRADPKKYQQVKKEDGGFDFYDGAGTPITVKQYADAQGKRVADVLKGSDNSSDIAFVRDYADMEDLMNAVYRGDLKKIVELNKAHPGLSDHIYGGYKIIKRKKDGELAFGDKDGNEVSAEEVARKSKVKPEEILKPFREYYAQKFSVEPQGLRARGANEPLYPRPQQQPQQATSLLGIGKDTQSSLYQAFRNKLGF